MAQPVIRAADLDRFLAAQERVYPGVLDELRRGRKSGHWIWFILPQIAGLGRSDVSRYYSIGSLAEARAYLAHPVLGARLIECAAIVAGLPETTATEIFGALDALKVRSCMTLFHRVAPDEPAFQAVLDRFYEGTTDDATDALLAAATDSTQDA